MVHHEGIREGLKAAPPVALSAANYAGLPLADWLCLLTIIYTVFLIIKSIPALPKAYACVSCFWKHRACDRRCKL